MIGIRERGMSEHDALLDAVAACRPILMTSVAMIAGMLPLALGSSAMAASVSPWPSR